MTRTSTSPSSTTMTKQTPPVSSSLHKSSSKKCLRFHQIEIIELPVTIGDNPSVDDGGPPLACGWDASMRVKMNIEAFETHRPKRRTGKGLILGKRDRLQLLLESGHKMDDIENAIMNTKRDNIDRMLSIQASLLSGSNKKISSPLLSQAKKDKLFELLAQANQVSKALSLQYATSIH